MKHTDDGQTGRFALTIDGTHAGELDYSYADAGTAVITHTGVDPSHRGKGLGLVLLRAFSEFAKEQQLSVVPRCSYAAAMYRKNWMQAWVASANDSGP